MPTVRVTGRAYQATAAGKVTFTPTKWAGYPVDGVLQGPTPITAPVAADGRFGADLHLTSDAEPGDWVYRVTFSVPGVSGDPFHVRVDGPGDLSEMIGLGETPPWIPNTPPWAIPDGRYALLGHTHDGYATTDHAHAQYALTNHTHSQYAAVSHTHSQYATTTQVAALDSRFVRVESNAVAVFVGTSNVDARAGSWVAKLCTRRGWINKNFAVGGMGYNFDASNSFQKQLERAAADTSFANADVKYVFVCDAANDARSGLGVFNAANTLISTAKTQFPNARIIILPVLISTHTIDRSKAFLAWIGHALNDLRTLAAIHNVEFIEHSWTWHLDDAGLILPNEVHYTAAGYDRIVYWVERYLAGQPTDSWRGWTNPSFGGKFAIRDTDILRGLAVTRQGTDVRIAGHFQCNSAAVMGDVVCNVPVGMRPNQDSVPIPIFDHVAGTSMIGTVGLGGDIQVWQSIPAGRQMSIYGATWAYV